MKYKIIKNGMDDYTLTYREEKIHFKSKVGIVEELQNVNKKARMEMVDDLAKKGKTVKSLIVETHVDGKTIQDHSNKDFIEQGYIEEEQAKVFTKSVEEMLGVSYETLIKEIGLTTEEEVEEFAAKLGECLVPSR